MACTVVRLLAVIAREDAVADTGADDDDANVVGAAIMPCTHLASR